MINSDQAERCVFTFLRNETAALASPFLKNVFNISFGISLKNNKKQDSSVLKTYFSTTTCKHN